MTSLSQGLKKADQQIILDDLNKHGPGFTWPSVSGAMPQVVPIYLHCCCRQIHQAKLDEVANTKEMAVKGGVILPSHPGLSTSSRKY
ncbi:hypothetical protein DY000_02031760 [Brassica cretica]|uniref:Uncharacterized protein n=1 Tax=Brassica cretica TaxID=69181 RepID=A0ABQ7DRD2_BRACR|nr:hypothetical protein DY000_02031760 [Brassica cretica]